MPFKFGNTTIDVLKFNNTTLNLLKYKENASAQAVIVFRSKHKIKFANGGGTGSMSDQTLEYDLATNINENKFTKQYYTFDKWSGSDGVTYKNKQSVNLKLDAGQELTLTAQWTPVPYDITYNLNGGSWNSGYSVPSSYNVASHVTLPTSSNISREGYSFDGWFTSSNLSGSAVTSTSGNGDKTYYAKWTPVPYNITYNLNGGSWNSGYNAPKSYTVVSHATLPTSLNVTYNGYTFTGWFTSSDLSGSAVSKTNGTGKKTYYAKWTKITAVTSTTTYTIPKDTEEASTEALNLRDYRYLYMYLSYHNPYETDHEVKLFINGTELRPNNHAFWTDLDQETDDSTFRIVARIDILNYKPSSNVVIKCQHTGGRSSSYADIHFKIARSWDDIQVKLRKKTTSNQGVVDEYYMTNFSGNKLVGAPRGVTFNGSTTSSYQDYTENDYEFGNY